MDIILLSPKWETNNLVAIVRALDRSLSDHTPLFLDTSGIIPRRNMFKFELCWLIRDDKMI